MSKNDEKYVEMCKFRQLRIGIELGELINVHKYTLCIPVYAMLPLHFIYYTYIIRGQKNIVKSSTCGSYLACGLLKGTQSVLVRVKILLKDFIFITGFCLLEEIKIFHGRLQTLCQMIALRF